MRHTSRFLLALILLPALAVTRAGASAIAVYHTSDVHGWYFSRPAAWDNANSTRPIGGFAALSSLLKKETTPYILLDSGDMWQGTPEGMITRGLASAVLMNQLGYSAAVPGNHDFDYGEPALHDLAAKARFPILAANIYRRDDGKRPSYLEPFTFIEKAGKNIAVLGLAGRHTATSTRPSNVKHLEFRDEAAEAAERVAEIKQGHPDAIIVITHLGLDEAFSLKTLDISTWTLTAPATSTLNIARAAPGIGLLLGGHNHMAMLKGWKDPVSGTVFGESGYGLSYVTRALMDFDDATGKVRSITVNVIPLWTDVTGEDPVVLKTVTAYSAEVEAAMGRKIGAAAGDLKASPEWLDSSIGDWFCDLTRKETGADLAFHNTKAIRADILKGPVYLRQLYQAFPFDNTIITMRLNGAQVKRLIEDNLHDGMAYIQVSGLQVEFTPGQDRKPARVRLLRNGREIKPDEQFTVATNDYLAFGGNGGGVFAEGKDIKDTMLPMRDLARRAFEKGPVTPPATGRIRIVK